MEEWPSGKAPVLKIGEGVMSPCVSSILTSSFTRRQVMGPDSLQNCFGRGSIPRSPASEGWQSGNAAGC